jgi:predicted nucleotide-binding protein (sugar kinase/HSP70/actin superfamily)
MLIRKSIREFFKARPELIKVPPVVRRPGRKQNIAHRPSPSSEGSELFLIALPTVRQLRVQIISKIVFSTLSKLESDTLLTILPLISLQPDEDTITENVLFRDFSSLNIPHQALEEFAEELKERNLLSFIPTRDLSRMKTELLCVRRWRGKKKVIFPQRKRGYDDKGNLAPPDQINWREIAMVTSDEPLNFENQYDNISNSGRRDYVGYSRLTRQPAGKTYREAETFIEEFLTKQRSRQL